MMRSYIVHLPEAVLTVRATAHAIERACQFTNQNPGIGPILADVKVGRR